MAEFNYDIDTTNYREQIIDFPNQIERALKLGDQLIIADKVTKIVCIGMGGSGLPGEFLKDYLHDEKIPVFSVRDYDVPGFVDKETAVFIISYSGNTEETIAAYRKVTRFGGPIIVISSGGKLEQLSSMYNSQYIKVPNGLPPRAAMAYMTIPIIQILGRSRIISDRTADIRQTIQTLKKSVYEEYGKDMALKMGDKIPIIYASTNLGIVAYKWKISFNENAKVMAFSNVIPEMNHNELAGYEHADGRFFTLIFKDLSGDDPRVRKRVEILKDSIKEKGNDAVEMAIRGDNLLSRMLSAIYLGDWTSYYFALLHGTDPAPTTIIEQFKEKMK